MADGSVLIDTKLNTSPVEKGLASLKGLFSNSGIASVGRAAFAGITASVAAASAALTAMGGFAVNAGTSFDTAMSQVAATMGTTVDDITLLSDTAKRMGATTAFSATEAAEALNYLALAGYDATMAADVLPAVLDLAAAGSMDLAYASDLATDAMSALGIEASSSNLTAFGDQMAMTASKANTSVAQLGEAILNIGGTAKGLAGGTVELNTALGVLANRGIKGSEAGNHLRNVIMSLTAPTDQARKALKKMGIQVSDSQGKMRPLNEIMADFNTQLDEMTDVEKKEALAEIFNKEDLASVEALLAGCGVEWEELYGFILDADGAMSDMAKTQLDNLTGDVTILKSALEGLGIAAYEQIRGPLRKLVQYTTTLVDRLSGALTEGGFSAFAAELGSVLADGLVELTTYLPQVVTMGSDVITALVQGITENSDQIANSIVNALGALATAVIGLLPDLSVAAAKLILSLAERLPNLLKLIVSAVKDIDWAQTGSEILNLIVGAFSSWTDTAGDLGTFASTLISGISTSLTSEDGGSIATAFGSLVAGITSDDMITAAGTLAQALFDALVSGLGAITSGAASLAGAFAGFMAGMNKADFGTDIGTAATTIVDAIVDAIAAITTTPDMSSLVTNIGKGIEESISFLGDIAGAIVGYVLSEEGLSSLAKAGKGIWDAIWGGICSALLGAANGVTEVFLSLFEIVADSVCKLFGLDFGESMTESMNNATFEGVDGSKMSGKILNSLIGSQQHTITEQAQAYTALVAAGFADAANEADFTPAGVAIATALQNSLTASQTGTEQWAADFSAEQTQMMAALIATGMDAGFAEQYPALYAAGMMAGDGMTAGVESLIPLMQELGMEVPQTFAEALGNESAWSASNEVVDEGLEKLKNTIEQQGQETKEATEILEGYDTAASDVADSVSESATEATTAAEEIASAAESAAQAETAVTTAQETVSTATTTMETDAAVALETMNLTVEEIKTTVSALMTSLTEAINAGTEALSLAASGAGNAVLVGFQTELGIVDEESTVFAEMGTTLVTSVAKGIETSATMTAFSTAANGVYTAVKSALDLSIGANGSKFRTVGINICKGVAKGIEQGRSSVISAAVQMAVDAYLAACGALGINSPSRKFAEIGMYCAQGLANGLTDNSADFAGAYRGLIDEARDYVANSDLFGAAAERMRMAVETRTRALIDATGFDDVHGIDYQELARAIWDEAPEELGITQTVNFYEPVQTPDETARAIRFNNTRGLVGGKR